jgi:hypothetical protein
VVKATRNIIAVIVNRGIEAESKDVEGVSVTLGLTGARALFPRILDQPVVM